MRQNRFHNNHKGFSLVEMLCAVAIFSLVSGIIGTVVVVSARTYRSGVSETGIQQEAQEAANNISNLVKDACDVAYEENTLKIITNDTVQYQIQYSAADHKLLYKEIADTDGSSASNVQILAGNVESFNADVDQFEETRTIRLSMEIKDEDTGRTIPLEYTMKSRNDVVSDREFASVSDAPVVLFMETNVIMVPGETYSIPIYTSGVEAGLEVSGSGCEASVTLDSVTVTVPMDTTYSSASITVSTKDKNSDGSPKTTAGTSIRIRRVKHVTVTQSVDRTNAEDGSYEGKGAVYTFYANVTGDNLSQSIGAACDENYKPAKAVTWSYELTAGGSDYTWNSDDNSVPSGAAKYVNITSYDADSASPTLKMELVQTMTSDFKLVVTATSQHAAGVNKANSAYDTVEGSITVEPRATKVSASKDELYLEPYEEGTVDLKMLGGVSSNVTFEYDGRSDSKTKAAYDAATGKVTVTPGSDEQGKDSSYTFTVKVLVDGKEQVKIPVHVIRVDAVAVNMTQGGTKSAPTYTFNMSYNPDTNTSYLTADSLTTLIKLEVINHNNNDKVLSTQSVICKAGETPTLNATNYYTVSSIKAEAVASDGTITQTPELTLSNVKLSNNYELKVTMEALHPYNSTGTPVNKAGRPYTSGEVSDSESIWGTKIMSIPTEYVIAEPGQGTDAATASDEELVIPITVKSTEITSMSAVISGNTDSGTRLSSYSSDNKNNPYEGTRATGTTEGVWYLGLVIGTNETGSNKSGVMTVTVTGKDDSGETVDTLEFKVCLRRVNTVTVSAESTWSKTWTLAAYPSGYDGTEYYAKQTDANGDCRWEKSGHGLYRSPYEMRWTMSYRGVEKPLEEWTEYVKDVSTATDANSGKATVTFTLVNGYLPSQAIIRAYSLHSEDRTVDGGSTKHNKAGKYYATVYGEYTRSNLIVRTTGFQRANEFTFVEGIVNMRSYVSDWSFDATQRCFMRYKEKTDPDSKWSQYYLMDDYSEYKGSMVGTKASRLFDPTVEYDLEIINVVYSATKKVIYWPLDSSLVQSGTGFEGFSLWDGTNSNYYGGSAAVTSIYETLKFATKVEDYRWTFDIPKVTLGMETGDYWNVASGQTLSGMTSTNPLHLKTGDTLAVKLTTTSYSLYKTQGYFKAIIQVKNADGTWLNYAKASDSSDGWFLQTQSPQYYINNIYNNASGEYRILTYINNIPWCTISGTTTSGNNILIPTYVESNKDINLYDEYTGEGILYVTFNQ